MKRQRQDSQFNWSWRDEGEKEERVWMRRGTMINSLFLRFHHQCIAAAAILALRDYYLVRKRTENPFGIINVNIKLHCEYSPRWIRSAIVDILCRMSPGKMRSTNTIWTNALDTNINLKTSTKLLTTQMGQLEVAVTIFERCKMVWKSLWYAICLND